ncbi:MAG: hypothetical protein R3200_01590 [Xanthomonadales bacterium]|nr:hypothetical protein [Xanthomonadales bacterium]
MTRHIESYCHLGKIGVLVELEVNDADFATRTREFRSLARDLAMHIAAMSPIGIVPLEIGSRDAPALGESSLLDEQTLLRQAFVKQPELTVADRIQAAARELGSEINVRRFVRFAIDED